MGKYPGRLALDEQYPQAAIMRRMIGIFTLREETTVDDIVKTFGGNPQAALLLKGGVAEVLRASIERAPYEREHGM